MCPHPDPPEPPRAPALFDECRMVRAHGELDLTTVTPLAHALEGARAGCGRIFLIVDLSQVTFTDGSILEPLREAWDDCRDRQGWVRVVHTSSVIDLVLLAGGLLASFPAYASAQDAWRGTAATRRAAVRWTRRLGTG
ncbi:anti-anti-sigma factor [Streptomyces sp. cf386]|uniref:STAS domain-containing protein n=1 Tax=Streptomyces sp. cf386 TaxID=1761904 RepID=UPI000880AEC4|nr:STAS domain-containing protein [Streptomyces sp. cf386]SDO03332.1 anti-anti-sigma factor [Streptomyces sp. cf386]